MKFVVLISAHARDEIQGALREQGMRVDLIVHPDGIQKELVRNLADLTVDVEGKRRVRIYSV